MNYLIVLNDINLDSITAMYLYYQFIKMAGFNVKIYDKDNLKNIAEPLELNIEYENTIKDDDNIILINNDKALKIDEINVEKITEILSLVKINENDYPNANIKYEDVSLVSTILIERYRDYKIELSQKSKEMLMDLYKQNDKKLKNRDKIAYEYISLFFK